MPSAEYQPSTDVAISLPSLTLDISRLVSRIFHPTPTGVDRVEMAYARGLLRVAGEGVEFGAVLPHGGYRRLPRCAALRFLDRTEERWHRSGGVTQAETRRFALATLLSFLRFNAAARPSGSRIFVKASPNSLDRPDLIQSILRREQARMVCMVHDLIPIEYPEYARPKGAALHRKRIRTITEKSAGIIANSQATLNSLGAWLDKAQPRPHTAVAHLGTNFLLQGSGASLVEFRPYFVSIATIEPRKNHLLLLNIWRRMAEKCGEKTPKLILVGRRGWENEQVLDMIERCPPLQDCVEERGRLADSDIPPLLSGARALLMPSFAEGYGMPVTEALACGVPVLCSDLPALREAGQDVPCYLDPLDGPAWQRAIEDLASPESQIREQQQHALHAWRAPTWEGHIAILIHMLHKVAQ